MSGPFFGRGKFYLLNSGNARIANYIIKEVFVNCGPFIGNGRIRTGVRIERPGKNEIETKDRGRIGKKNSK